MMESNEYVKCNGSKCPNCGSENIEAGRIEQYSDSAASTVECHDCGANWSEVYELTRYEDLEVPEFEEVVFDKKYVATFTPEAWANDYAVEVDPEGPASWDCTAYLHKMLESGIDMHVKGARYIMSQADEGDRVLDSHDWLKHDKNAPKWVRDWSGPFSIHVERAEE